MTVLLRPQRVEQLESLPLLAATGISRALNSSLGVLAQVRWPNDVMTRNRKLAGVLSEMKLRGNQPEYVALGLGVNANFHVEAFPEIRESATSLLDALGSNVDRNAIVCKILEELEDMYESLMSGEKNRLLNVIRSVDWSRGKAIAVTTSEGRIDGVFDDYQSLAEVRIIAHDGSNIIVRTAETICANYPYPSG